jgi:predicted Zn-dependent protease
MMVNMMNRVSACVLSLAMCMPLAQAREGVDVGKKSGFSSLVSADQVEQMAAQQYLQLAGKARAQNALLPDNHPQVIRVRAIARRLIPHSLEWNQRASQWRWEVNVLQSKEINAFCMPGGKIAFYTGILDQLQLSDDEVAIVMGHEMAHALREHAREQMGKSAFTGIGASVISSLFGLGRMGDLVLSTGRSLLTLSFGREDETEADLVGMDMAARAGYDPRMGVTLWQKMGQASKGAPPQFLSTHPASSTRIQDIQANLPKVMPLFQRAEKPAQRFDQRK